VSTSGGLINAIDRGLLLGAGAIQIFGASPRQWAVKMPTDEEASLFKKEFASSGLKHLFLHATYLANLATPDATSLKKSIDALASHLKIAEMLGADGLIFHVGSTKGLITKEKAIAQIAKAMLEVVKRVPGKAKLIMENGSGGGGKIGSEPSDLKAILLASDSERISVCLDTAHAFGAGIFDLAQWDSELGLKNICVLHANDSKAALGSLKDRHENIGEGEIGIEVFKKWGKDKYLGKLPWLLEVPGFDNEGPDKKNVDILKSCF